MCFNIPCVEFIIKTITDSENILIGYFNITQKTMHIIKLLFKATLDLYNI